MLIDSHCHLEPEDFRTKDGEDERPAVLQRAAEAGVVQMIVIGSGHGLAEVRNAVHLSHTHPHLFAAIGVHPHDAGALVSAEEGEALWEEIARLAHEDQRVVAVGESGLDYYYKHSTPPQQQALLRRFVRLSQDSRKPLSLHIRDAHEDARRIVAEAGGLPAGGVIHCFTGTPDDARAWLGLGLSISLSGIVTFRTATPIQEACKLVPTDRLLLETDCPYLAPVPMRGRRNEPAYLVHTAEFVARLRGVPLEQLAVETTEATRALFGLTCTQYEARNTPSPPHVLRKS